MPKDAAAAAPRSWIGRHPPEAAEGVVDRAPDAVLGSAGRREQTGQFEVSRDHARADRFRPGAEHSVQPDPVRTKVPTGRHAARCRIASRQILAASARPVVTLAFSNPAFSQFALIASATSHTVEPIASPYHLKHAADHGRSATNRSKYLR